MPSSGITNDDHSNSGKLDPTAGTSVDDANSHQRILTSISTAISDPTSDLDALFQPVVEQLATTLKDGVSLHLIHDDFVLEPVAAHHVDPVTLAFVREISRHPPQRVREGLVGTVAASGKALWIPRLDVDQIREQVRPESLAYLERFNARSVMAVPVTFRGRVLGVIAASRDQTPEPYTEDDLHFLEDVAGWVALMISAFESVDTRYVNLIQNMPAAIFVAEPGNLFTTRYQSPRLRTMLRYTEAEWNSSPKMWASRVHPADRRFVADACDRAAEAGEPIEVEFRQVTSDGRTIWAHCDAVLVHDSNGTPSYWVGVIHDTTQSRLAADELREKEVRFRSAFDSAAIGMALVGLNGRWLDVNRPMCSMLGYTREELQGTTFQAVTHPDDLDADLEQAGQLQRGEISSYSMEKRYIHKSGKEIWALLTGSAVRDREGNALYFIAQVQDITQQKLAAEELRRRAEEFELLVENNPDIVARFDQDFRHVYINHAIEKMTGIPVSQYLGRTNRELGYPSHVVDEWEAAVRNVFATSERVETEFVVDLPDGPAWFEGRLAPETGPEGTVETVLSITRDISPQKRAEQAVKANEQRLKRVIETAPSAILLFDQHGVLEMANANAEQQLEVATTDRPTITDILERFARDSGWTRDRVDQIWRDIDTDQLVTDIEVRTTMSDGSNRFGVAYIYSIHEDDGRGSGHVLVVRDVTESKAITDQLRQQATLLQMAHDAVIVRRFDNNVITYWNTGAEEVYGWSAGEAVGAIADKLLGSAYFETTEQIKQRLQQAGRWDGEILQQTRDNGQITVRSRQAIVHNDREEPVGIFQIDRDISEEKRLQAQLIDQARHDSLTRLPNRRYFLDQLECSMAAAIHDAGQLTLLYIDLNGFKAVNDTYGHDIGDQLLIEIARRIGRCLGHDDIAARLGGDEFVVLLSSTTADEASEMADRIRAAVDEPIRTTGPVVRGVCSIGIATSRPEPGQAPEALIRQADKAMYRDKGHDRELNGFRTITADPGNGVNSLTERCLPDG